MPTLNELFKLVGDKPKTPSEIVVGRDLRSDLQRLTMDTIMRHDESVWHVSWGHVLCNQRLGPALNACHQQPGEGPIQGRVAVRSGFG